MTALLLALALTADPDAPPMPRVQWVVFRADWCAPCIAAGNDYRPYFERLRPKKLMVSVVPHADIRLIDIDLEREFLKEWEKDHWAINRVPQFVLMVDGEPVEAHWRYPGKKRMHEQYLEAVNNLGPKK